MRARVQEGARLQRAVTDVIPASSRRTPLYLSLRFAPDVPAARQRTRRVAEVVGLPLTDQVRLATAVSELARCALLQHGGGAVDFALEPERSPAALVVTVSAGVVIGAGGTSPPDKAGCMQGPAETMQLSRRLVDDLVAMPPTSHGPVVALKMRLPLGSEDAAGALAQLTHDVVEQGADDPLEEIRRQNQELMRLLDELHERTDALARLNEELEQTNRGMVALHAELEDANTVITRIAATDPLSGIANRRHFSESLAKAVALARRHGYPLAVASFDLDRLKQVNDSCGHEAGDVIIMSFATLLSSLCREADLPARPGGDEFSVLLPGIDERGARMFAERVCAATRGCPEIHVHDVTVSGGVAAWAHGESPADLLRHADDALYAAKHSGGDTVTGGDSARLIDEPGSD